MRKSKFTESQRREILPKWDAGATLDELCRRYQVSTATLYKWKKDQSDEAGKGKHHYYFHQVLSIIE